MSNVPCALHLDVLPASVYREYAPPPSLRRYLVCAWTLDIAAGTRPHRQRILPDGCSDIVWIGEAPPIVVGPMTRSMVSTSEAGATLVGLRFRPEAAARTFGVPAADLTDRHVALEDLWCRQDVGDTSSRLLEQRTSVARVAVAQSLLASRHHAIAAGDPVVHQALSFMATREPIRHVAAEVGINERQLRRRFLHAVGYSPKTFQRILRFQRLLAIASSRPAARLHQLALMAGYADQAHMTREVAQFAGATPSALLGRVVSALTFADIVADS